MNTNEHIDTFDFIMDLYQLETDLIALVGDNMETNQCVARWLNMNISFTQTFDGCNEWISAHLPLLKEVSVVMAKFRSVKRWATMSLLGSPVKPYDLLKRFERIQRYFVHFHEDTDVLRDIPDSRKTLLECITTPAEQLTLKNVKEHMGPVEMMSKKLQRNDTTLADVRDCFGEYLEDPTYASMGGYLASAANIVSWKDFENEIVKEDSLSKSEILAVRKLLKNVAGKDGLVKGKPPCTIENIKRSIQDRKRQRLMGQSRYINVQWISPTSNRVEHFFLAAQSNDGILA
ncbi:hypothetical protein PsorP6_016608 [Peronosclerospora sorghi]|uniref:Uncharacterized protein n=1 Tax=Peronosclerospora sorghi TaxID=230839 RepID=A0ACC0VKQ1_9STRA|nr:hypothetical protein PsorP6_016608 [Peronosclerospora sorghi]